MLGCEVPSICSDVVTCVVYVYIGIAILHVVILHPWIESEEVLWFSHVLGEYPVHEFRNKSPV